jgi:hypothetical protein
MPAPAVPPCDARSLKLSVLVAVMDRSEIAQSIEALAAQKGIQPDQFDVWVTEATRVGPWQRRARAVVRSRMSALGWHFLEAEPRGRAAAVNAMMRHATGDILLLLADDFIPDCKLLARHLHFHERHPEIHRAAVGPGLFPERFRLNRFTRWLEDSGTLFGVPFTDPQLSLPKAYFYAGNTSVKRALFDKAGSFDERFPYDAWDDYEMGLRLAQAGYEATYLPKAFCVHEHRVSLSGRTTQVRLGGRSAAIFDDCHDDVQPWHQMVRSTAPPSRLQWWRELASAWLHHALNRHDADCETAYYRLRLDHAFVSGYVLQKRETECAVHPGERCAS